MFFRGFGATIGRAFLVNGAIFTAYELSHQALLGLEQSGQGLGRQGQGGTAQGRSLQQQQRQERQQQRQQEGIGDGEDVGEEQCRQGSAMAGGPQGVSQAAAEAVAPS